MSVNSLVSSTQLIAVERPLIMRALDYPGYVPIIGGIPVGVVRLISSLAGAIISGLGALFTCWSDKLYGRCTFAVKYLLDELVRGFCEVFCLSYYLDKIKENEEAKKGIITEHGGASGKYIYESPFPHGFMAYSNDNHGNKNVQWTSRKLGDEVRGIYGHIGQNS
jgi:hypothetical protein